MRRAWQLIGVASFSTLAVAAGQSIRPGSSRSHPAPDKPSKPVAPSPVVHLMAVGDSLTHGTMDATNNSINTLHGYLQLTADSLSQQVPLHFSQPLFDESGKRIAPRNIPTNLAVDGADIFSLEGIEYFKRVGAAESFVAEHYLCDVRLARRLDDAYDKVLYPINVKAGMDVSQIDAAIWLVNELAPPGSPDKVLLVFWAGNNDASTASLGSGGDNPMFLPVPADLIANDVTPLLRFLLRAGPRLGAISYDAYTPATIERNLTELNHFEAQFNHLLDRLTNETNGALTDGRMELLVVTLPHYSSIGYLMDSEDIEFYLRQIDPGYSVPATFARVAPDGEPILDPTLGDRISLLTFGLMYLLLDSGYSTEYVNRALEIDGIQRGALVLSHSEQHQIAARIDGFNQIITTAASGRGSHVHLLDIGTPLNDALNGKTAIQVNGRLLSRKWTRGGAFTLDGVHPGYTGQAIISNLLQGELNQRFGFGAALLDLGAIAASDPYWDRDGDGWASGPGYAVSGLASVLALLTDTNDEDPAIGPSLPADVWEQLSGAILSDLLGIPALQSLALEQGFVLDP